MKINYEDAGAEDRQDPEDKEPGAARLHAGVCALHHARLWPHVLSGSYPHPAQKYSAEVRETAKKIFFSGSATKRGGGVGSTG